MDVAARITAAFAEQIGAARYHLWFPSNARFTVCETALEITCRNEHFRDWSRDQFGETLLQAAKSVIVGEVSICFRVDGSIFADVEVLDVDAKPREPKQVNLFGERELPPRQKREERPARRLKAIGDFIIGPGNRVAAAAAQGILDDPGLSPNPLVIFGPTGTGKTHLLEAVTTGLKSLSPRPLYLPAEEFTHRFIQSARTGKTSGFRKLTRAAGAFILDDLQFVANKRGTQEELIHVIDSYLSDGKPVVLGLDTHPRLADDLLPELVDRLLGGAAWGLLPPDDETRYRILKAKATPPIADDVLKHLARSLSGNVRELEGAIHTLRHFAKVTGETITLAIAQDLLADLMRHTVRAIALGDVDRATCKVFRLSGGSLQSKARTVAVTQPRMVAIYLARKHTTATYGEIAKHFGVRQHSTAVAGEKKVRAWLHEKTLFANTPAADVIARIERELFR